MIKKLIEFIVVAGVVAVSAINTDVDIEVPPPAPVVQEVEMVEQGSLGETVADEPEKDYYIGNSTNLFEKEKGNRYNYCPSAFTDGNLIHVYYCANQSLGEVKDVIAYRECRDNGDGTYSYSEQKEVLSPSNDSWDSMHVCDPSVVKGKFGCAGQEYSYLMAYLGCKTDDCQNNSIGLAVADHPAGPWVKISFQDPFIGYVRDTDYPDTFQWGYGQPSLINMDENGKVLLTYTSGTHNLTSQIAEVWDLNDFSNPQLIARTTISNGNLYLTDGSGGSDFISNAEFSYDKNSKKMYMVSDTHPYTGSVLSNIPSESRVVAISAEDMRTITDTLAVAQWKPVKMVDKSVTGYSKNHNCSFIRDCYGYWDSGATAEEKGTFLDSLWTYQIQIVK